jgi:hypothetical protein
MTTAFNGLMDVDQAPDTIAGLACEPRLAPDGGPDGPHASGASHGGSGVLAASAWMSEAKRAFWAHVESGPRSECWSWTGHKDQRGYGLLRVQGRLLRAHRVSWMLHHGPIPRGLCILHACDNPPCTNPDHLMLGTVRANAVDAARKGRAKGGSAVGEQNGRAKLSEETVRAIRTDPRRRYCDLAREFGISLSTAWNAKNRKTWRHIP